MGRLRPTSGAPALPTEEERTTNGLADVLGARVHVDVVVPRTKIAGKLRLLSRSEMAEARLATLYAFSQDGRDKAPAHIYAEEWNIELDARIVSLAVRDPNDVTRQLADINEWRECDEDQIVALFVAYKDLADRLDPLGENVEITVEELRQMTEAAKKKHDDILTSFGSQKLARFAITLVDQPAT